MEMAASGPQNLRERTREAVREQVRTVAVDLFSTQGFDATTTDDIAAAVGISRRSFFRYFATKEEVLTSGSMAFGDRVRDSLAARPTDEPIWLSLRRSLDPVAATDSSGSLRIVSIGMSTATLRAHGYEKHLAWERMILPIIVERLGKAGESTERRAEMLAHAAMACLDVAMAQWVRHQGEGELSRLLDEAFASVEAIPELA